MRTVLICLVALVGSASFVHGQRQHLRRIVYAPNTQITASDITYDDTERTTHARGQVRIVSESSTITADEADLHLTNMDRFTQHMSVELRGNVRVVLTPELRP
jgi:lipopolysaccharide export system protein LptA